MKAQPYILALIVLVVVELTAVAQEAVVPGEERGQGDAREDVAELLRRARFGNQQERLLALKGLCHAAVKEELAEHKPSVMKWCAQLLTKEEREVSNAAADVLRWCGTDAGPLLIELIQIDDPDVQARAAGALSTIATVNSDDVEQLDAAIPHLARLLRSDSVAVKFNAYGALLRMGPLSIPPLMEVLDPDGPLRDRAPMELVRSLARYGTISTPLLCEALKDDRAQMRRNAAYALSRFPEFSPDLLPHLEKHALGPLTQAVSDEDVVVREWAIRGLGGMRGRAQSSLDEIVAALDEPDAPYAAIAYAASQIGPRLEHLPVFFEAAQRFSENKSDRGRAAHGFGQAIAAVGETTVEPLRRSLKSEDEIERKTAIHALIFLGPIAAPAVPDIIQEMEHGNLGAIDVLASVGPKAAEAVPHLIARLEHDVAWQMHIMQDNYSSKYATILSAIGPPAVPALLAGCDHENYMVRTGCLIALAGISGDAEVDASAIEPTLADMHHLVRVAAIHAMVRHGERSEVISSLRKMMDDPHRNVAGAATRWVELLMEKDPDQTKELKTKGPE